MKVIASIKDIQQKNREAHAGCKERFVHMMESRPIRGKFKWLETPGQVRKLMALEDVWREIAVRNKLGQQISCPRGRARGVQNSNQKLH